MDTKLTFGLPTADNSISGVDTRQKCPNMTEGNTIFWESKGGYISWKYWNNKNKILQRDDFQMLTVGYIVLFESLSLVDMNWTRMYNQNVKTK